MIRLISMLALAVVLAGAQSASANNNTYQPANTLKTVVIKPDAREKVEFYHNSAVNEAKFRYQPAQVDEVVTVKILKTSGVKLQAFTLSKGLTKLKTHHLKPGIYQYQCVTAKGEAVTSGTFTVTY